MSIPSGFPTPPLPLQSRPCGGQQHRTVSIHLLRVRRRPCPIETIAACAPPAPRAHPQHFSRAPTAVPFPPTVADAADIGNAARYESCKSDAPCRSEMADVKPDVNNEQMSLRVKDAVRGAGAPANCSHDSTPLWAGGARPAWPPGTRGCAAVARLAISATVRVDRTGAALVPAARRPLPTDSGYGGRSRRARPPPAIRERRRPCAVMDVGSPSHEHCGGGGRPLEARPAPLPPSAPPVALPTATRR